MALDVVYFAWVREAIGKDGERVSLPNHVKSPMDLLVWLRERGDGYAEAFAEPGRIRVAIDQRFVPLDTDIGGAKEIAFFPPVTGG
jgi:molybdopterin synthase sulfur carrier subunit